VVSDKRAKEAEGHAWYATQHAGAQRTSRKQKSEGVLRLAGVCVVEEKPRETLIILS
jgi:hypothetical protein